MARRGRGEGSIFFEHDDRLPARWVVLDVDGSRRRVKRRGRWVGRITVDGQRHKIVAATKGEATRRLAELRSQAEQGLPIAAGDLLVSDLLDEWLRKGLPGRNVSPNTVASREWSVRVLCEELGTTRVRALTPNDVEAALARRARAGLGRASLSKMKTTMSLALTWAVRRGIVARDVAAVAELPAGARADATGKSMTRDEARRFVTALDASEDVQWRCAWLLMLHLGLRPAEAFGLTWPDVDLDSGVVHVRRALRRGARGEMTLGAPKTRRSERSLDVPGDVVAALRDHRTTQIERRLATGATWENPDALVFTNGVGSPVDQGRARSEFRRLLKLAKLSPKFTPVDLRHTCASLLSDSGVPIEVVSDQLGHVDGAMLAKHYRHGVRPTRGVGTAMSGLLAEEA